MKIFPKSIVISLLSTSFLLLAAISAFAQEDELSLKDLRIAIHEAITNASELADEEPYFIVTKVKMELQGKMDNEGGGGFKIPIYGVSVDLGGKEGYSYEEKLTIVMKPADTILVGGEIKIDLAGLIKSIKEAFKGEKDKNPAYILPEIEFKKKWALKHTAKGGIDFIIASGNVSIAKERQQIITFTLCETKNLVDCSE